MLAALLLSLLLLFSRLLRKFIELERINFDERFCSGGDVELAPPDDDDDDEA